MKTALVTGANKSIGFEVTKQLAQALHCAEDGIAAVLTELKTVSKELVEKEPKLEA